MFHQSGTGKSALTKSRTWRRLSHVSPVEGVISQLADCLHGAWSRCVVSSTSMKRNQNTPRNCVNYHWHHSNPVTLPKAWPKMSQGFLKESLDLFCTVVSFAQTFLMLPPDFFTINSSTIDWRQILIMIAWNHRLNMNKNLDCSTSFFDFLLLPGHSRWQWLLTCWLVMVTHWRRSLLIRYSKASSSLTSHLDEPQGLVVPLAIGTCCRGDQKGGELILGSRN